MLTLLVQSSITLNIIKKIKFAIIIIVIIKAPGESLKKIQ